jgi:threonine dehydratase
MSSFPIAVADVLQARRRIAPHLSPSPLRSYAPLDAAVGHGIRVFVKHENHLPTNAFKARNALSVLTALTAEERRRGVVGATRGNHGAGLAWAGASLGIPVTVCVPVGNSPEKNEAMRGFGATLIESGADYDEAVAVADGLVREKGMRLVHSTNDPLVIAGAATLTLEMLEQEPALEAIVFAVGAGHSGRRSARRENARADPARLCRPGRGSVGDPRFVARGQTSSATARRRSPTASRRAAPIR